MRAAPGRTDALLAAVRHLTSKPLRYLVDTGPDADHVGGNAAIVKAAGGILGGGTAAPELAAAVAATRRPIRTSAS